MQKNIIKAYRSIRHRGGHGIHSPFVYHLVTHVICCKPSGELGGMRLCRKGKLYFRLANEMKPQKVLQIGVMKGAPAVCHIAYSKKAECLIVEPSKKQIKTAKDQTPEKYKERISFANKTFTQYIAEVDEAELYKTDCFNVYFSHKPEEEAILLAEIVKVSNDSAYFIINDIRRNRAMIQAWKRLIAMKEVTVSLDLIDVGLIFVNRKYNKRNYISYY